MAQDLFSKSLIVVGGGIVGLVMAVAAQARGYQVTVIARDAPEDTASGVAAGMIAPALEALGEADPIEGFRRLTAAQQAWLELFAVWPRDLQIALSEAQTRQKAAWIWNIADTDKDPRPVLDSIGAIYTVLDDAAMCASGLTYETQAAVEINGDWLIEAPAALRSLQAHFEALGGNWRQERVAHVSATLVTLASGESVPADNVLIAAGYGARVFSADVPSLAVLSPIKGHLLDLPDGKGQGVMRSGQGYWARYDTFAKFGATMQPGQDDLSVEADKVANLKARAQGMAAEVVGVDAAVPRVGIRASSPDGWPMIGRDRESGVYVVTAMRRNGFVFAPLAAQVALNLMDGQIDNKTSEAARLYDPNRF